MSIASKPILPIESGIDKSQLDTQSIQTFEAGEVSQFRAALDRRMNATANATPPPVQPSVERPSLGDKIIGRATDLAGELKKDQLHISNLLEQATRTGDGMSLMKAMLAMNDYQTRVQFVSKSVSKATSSLDSLTKLQ